jgi:nicotinate-nucleotide adenylyltransferase
MKIGVFGGTFDPIHLGHLRAAETAREALALDRVAFVPAAVPPHRSRPLTAAADRLAMARLAASSHPAFEVWDIELRRPGPSYTVDTVATLLLEHPADSLVLVVGADTWPEMMGWRDPERLLSLVEVAVVDRAGMTCDAPVVPFRGALGVRQAAGPSLPISASAIRERVRQGLSVRYLVADVVADYIGRRGLYS